MAHPALALHAGGVGRWPRPRRPARRERGSSGERPAAQSRLARAAVRCDRPLADDEARALLEAVLDARARTVWARDALASSLKLVVSGRTLPGLDGGPLPVWEWLAVDSNVRAVLRDLEPERAAHAARGWVAAGDRSFRQAANELLRQTKISPETHQAFLAACSP
jgi:hypothetical protein